MAAKPCCGVRSLFLLHSSVNAEGSGAEGARKAADEVRSGILEAGAIQQKDCRTAPGWYDAKMRLQLSDIRFPIWLNLTCSYTLLVDLA